MVRLLHSQLDGFTSPDALTPRSRGLSVHISSYLTLAHLAPLASRLLYREDLDLSAFRAEWTLAFLPWSSGGHIHLVLSISGKASQKRCQIIRGPSFPSRLSILGLTFARGEEKTSLQCCNAAWIMFDVLIVNHARVEVARCSKMLKKERRARITRRNGVLLRKSPRPGESDRHDPPTVDGRYLSETSAGATVFISAFSG